MRKQLQEDDCKIKIIIVGDSGVGKSNIRERLCQNRFDPFSVKTAGVQVSTRKFYAPFQERQHRFVACFWDIVGQLSNRDLGSSFFKNIVGVIYVYDLTNHTSFQNLKLWKSKVEEKNSNRCISLLLGNKKDLQKLRQVSFQDAQKFQIEQKIQLFLEVSALDPIGGIQQAVFQYLTLIGKQFDFGLKKPTKLRRIQARHRSCI